MASTIRRPRTVVRVILARAVDEDLLHITPCQVLIGVVHQGDDAGGERCRARGAAEGVSDIAAAVVAAAAIDVGGGDCFTVAVRMGSDEDVCSWLCVV